MSKNQYYYAVGRRKESTAVVKLYPKGSAKYTVKTNNGKELSMKEFFGGNKYMFDMATQPLTVLGGEYSKMFDAHLTVKGGGRAGQADAIRLAFARALIEFDAELRLTLKPFGLLKRDSRVKERKKPGLKKARKGPTRSKR
jgi:small subunit ribosomal protein S9